MIFFAQCLHRRKSKEDSNKTNTNKKIDFFSYILNINENLKKTDENNVVLSAYNKATFLDQTLAIAW